MTWVGIQLSGKMRRLTLGAVVSVAAAALMAPLALASPESDASDAINQAWQAAGGSGSTVGSPEGEVYQVGAGYGQKFTNGKIFFTPETGAHLILGAILDKYESLGGAADSDLGFPNIDEVPGLVGPDSRVSTFSASDKPAIFWTPDTGAWAVRGAINAAWDKLGGSAGVLGVPIEDERYDGDVVSQKFTGGELSWNRSTNTFTSDPPGLADSLVGLEVPWDPVTQINLAWRATGGLGGPLAARQGELTTIGNDAAAQGYAGGKIFYSPQTGAHAVTGAILSKYESAGGPTGDLGFPAGDEADGGVPNSRVSTFSAPDKPVIFWTPDTGAVVVRGPINAAWAKLGGATGELGVPTGEQTVKGDTITQAFSGGELSWNKATREFSSKPPELASSLSGLEMPDAVAQTPAAPASGGDSKKGGWHWWWLAIIIPLVLLLGLLALLARRKARPERDAGGEIFGGGSGEDNWLAPHARSDRYGSEAGGDSGLWSAPSSGGDDGGGFDSDEDAIDTAPTRIPTAADLDDFRSSTADLDDFRSSAAEISESGGDEFGKGRHAVDAAGASPAAWRLELDEILNESRRRHAGSEPWTQEFDAVVEERIEQVEYEPEPEPEYQSEPEFGSAPDSEAEREPAEEVAPAEDPWRPAIHLPLADPLQAPEGYSIKGNTHSGLYYTPESALYENTIPEVWFASEEVAESNGFVRAPE